jgi:hypothetical protein
MEVNFSKRQLVTTNREKDAMVNLITARLENT